MDDQSNNPQQWLKDLPVTAETPGFKPEEMVACEKCSRQNPPTRLKCFYCGEQLSLGNAQAELAAPTLRQMEVWEKGFNVILTGKHQAPPADEIGGIAKLLKRETQEIKSVLDKNEALPLVRTDSLPEAEIIKQRLLKSGVETFIWPDEEAGVDQPTRRLRGLEIGENTITFLPFNKGAAETLGWEDMVLVVTGSIFAKKITSTEKRRKNDEKQVVESSETSADEPVIDIYGRSDGIGWRVQTTGFDFSCLGAEKSLLAVENMKRLVGFISGKAPNARIVSDYVKVRGALGRVWENEEKMASHKWQRETMGKFHFDSVTAVDNVAQFTKYSRLQWRLLSEK